MGDHGYYDEAHAAQEWAKERYEPPEMGSLSDLIKAGHNVTSIDMAQEPELAHGTLVRFAAANVKLQNWPPTREDWRRLRASERRQERVQNRSTMDIEQKINALTEALVELQSTKRLREPLKALKNIGDGAVVKCTKQFEEGGIQYVYAAIKGANVWFITGHQSPQGLDDNAFIEWLDKAQEVELLAPYVRTLRRWQTETTQYEAYCDGEMERDESGYKPRSQQEADEMQREA